ncbi:MAG: HAMP domain-containing sensor histidine kinase [Bdellovibrionota bacterium]|nr:HAMP domain-containing sensor histidine kinase [Bdellovibrionota bacterium]
MAAKIIEASNDLNFEEICDSAMMAILVFNAESMSLLYLNRLAIETLEMNEADLKGFYLEKLYPQSHHSKARAFAEEFIQDSGFYQDMQMKRMNGINFIANLGVSKIHEGKILLLMFQDVSFQKKLQREVQVKQQELMRSYTEILEQNAELQSLSEAKDKLITLSTHELRTPLSAIIAMTESLSLGVIEDKEELDSYHQDINREAQSLMGILNGMLDLLKLTTKKMPFFVWEHSLFEALEEEIVYFSEKLDAKNIKLVKMYSNENASAYFDKIRFRQVIRAVIDNAIKFSPENTEISISLRSNEEFCSIGIKDEGPGVPKENHAHIFEEFTTLGDIDTHSKGAGISLSIAKLSIEQMGGKIELISENKQGCLFILQIPRTRVLADEMYDEENPYEDIEF